MADQVKELTLQTPVRVIETCPGSRSEPALPGFEHRFATVDGDRLHYLIGGKTGKDVVILVAGFPESWYAWRKVMPLLATEYEVVAVDLPGQGDSDRPENGYDTEALAAKLHSLLQQIGVERYFLAAHDVGAWVAFPYAALYGKEVRRLALLDAGIPGVTLPDALPTAPDRAWRTWHFAFHAIPDLPEVLIAGREREYLNWFLRRKVADPSIFSDADMEEYLRALVAPGGLRAGLAYYRAAALSAKQNQVLIAKGKLKMPILALSADQGSIPDMSSLLKNFADDVHGGMVAHCGHFLPEEQPVAVAQELATFFSK
ncbi:alpha/beta fold hydrolase [Nostoc sp.]|uniref:alpha/beta fold hydrolase n=1 Tax=Nostoc sp. TaxID=1180 RepID=UPI002FFBA786